MKFETIECYKQVPTVIATGVPGGGYVGIKATAASYIGTVDWLSDSKKCIQIPSLPDFFKLYLEEGEELYGKGGSTTYPLQYGTYTVIYYNQEPSPQNNTPMNFTGSINLSQN